MRQLTIHVQVLLEIEAPDGNKSLFEPDEWIQGLILPRSGEVLCLAGSDDSKDAALLRVVRVEHILIAAEGGLSQKIRILTEGLTAPKPTRKGTGTLKPFVHLR